MATRRLVLAALALALGACSNGEAEQAERGEMVFCALGGSPDFKDQCRLERSTVDGAQVIVVRHPDGAFHRLEVSEDGEHLEAADGADLTQSALKGDRFEVILGRDRYVIPASPPVASDAQSK